MSEAIKVPEEQTHSDKPERTVGDRAVERATEQGDYACIERCQQDTEHESNSKAEREEGTIIDGSRDDANDQQEFATVLRSPAYRGHMVVASHRGLNE